MWVRESFMRMVWLKGLLQRSVFETAIDQQKNEIIWNKKDEKGGLLWEKNPRCYTFVRSVKDELKIKWKSKVTGESIRDIEKICMKKWFNWKL